MANKIKYIVFAIALLIIIVCGPRLLAKRHIRVDSIYPNVVYSESEFVNNPIFTIKGKNLQDTFAVLVNGIWQSDYDISVIDDSQIQISLNPDDLRKNTKLKISLESKINSDLNIKVNAGVVNILSEEDATAPEIKKVEMVGLGDNKESYEHSILEEISIIGDRFTNQSFIYINNHQLPTEYVENKDGSKKLKASVPILYVWEHEKMNVRVVQMVGDYASNIQSNVYRINYTDLNMPEKERPTTSTVINEYLRKVIDGDYGMLVSVRGGITLESLDSFVKPFEEKGIYVDDFVSYNDGSCIMVYKDDEVIYQEHADNSGLIYSEKIGVDDVYIFSGGTVLGDAAFIKINDIDLSINNRGINIVVFDESKHRVVDTVCINNENSLDYD